MQRSKSNKFIAHLRIDYVRMLKAIETLGEPKVDNQLKNTQKPWISDNFHANWLGVDDIHLCAINNPLDAEYEWNN